MTVPSIILFVYLINWIFEVNHDDALRKIRNILLTLASQLEALAKAYGEDIRVNWIDEKILSDKWHRIDFRSHALIACLITGLVVFYENSFSFLALAPAIGFQRMIILNVGLNIKSKRKKKNGKRDLFYLGEGEIDKTLKNWFGNWWILAILTLFLLCISIMIWI